MITFENLFSQLRKKNTELVDQTLERYLSLETPQNLHTLKIFITQNEVDISSKITKNVEDALIELGRSGVVVTSEQISEIRNESSSGAFYWSTKLSDLNDRLIGRITPNPDDRSNQSYV